VGFFEVTPIVTATREARMLKRTRMRSGSPVLWAAALALGAPALVQAQTQLFPLAPIQRQRVPCPMEDPVYGLYRQQYYGYFPTCWRRFPPGWGCPSPEAPNASQAFQEQPRDKLRPLNDEGAPEPMPGEEPAGPRGRAVPPLPREERSPFELDTQPNPNAPGGRMPSPDVPGAAAAPRTAPALRRTAPAPAFTAERSDSVEGAAPLLALPAPAEALPGPTTPAPGDSSALDPNSAGRPGFSPGSAAGPSAVIASLPALPNPELPRQTTIANPTFSPSLDETTGPALPATPVQAPQRRGPLSSLFNGLTSYLRR